MIYPSSFESKIGFSTVREWLKSHCLSPLGQSRCDAMRFNTDFGTVRRLLTQTDEMLRLINMGKQLPLDGIHDVTPQLKTLHTPGTILTTTEFYRLRASLETIAQVYELFTPQSAEEQPEFPALSSLFSSMMTFPSLIRGIGKVVNRFGEIQDNATAELASIRKSIASAQASVSATMQRVLASAVTSGVVEGGVTPSMRDGRLVIPVPSASKRRIQGIVHDESATGKTSYIEPVEVVEATNRLRELREEEKREIHRILLLLTDELRPHVPDILQSYTKLGLYDFIHAKAQLAKEFDAQMPVLEKGVEIDWFGAFHPVLAHSLKQKGQSVVPLNLHLDARQRILIISGPNAGGKSVCLKTAGIVQYMLQCGLLPTMYSNSHACVFDSIMIDIGDEQSIENDLSTYSSHLRNMKAFLANAGSRTFVLVDEMGSGTEPQIGGALAQAILKKLNESKVIGIITTHYQNLKTFADEAEGFVNGAMLYDRQNMQPLFQLSIGNPGSSFAIEIARKTGLPREVIEDARDIVGSDYVNMDKYLLDLARDKRYWENKRKQIKEKEQRLDVAIERYDARLEDIKAKRQEIIAEARKEALDLLADSNARLERTIMEVRRSQAEKEQTKKVRRELEEYKESLKEIPVRQEHRELKGVFQPQKRKASKPEDALKPKPVNDAIAVGDYVRMSKGGTVGTVLSISGKNAEVAFGALRTRVAVDKLIKTIKPQTSVASQSQSVSRTTTDESRKRQLDFKQEIDLRGMRADEALQAVIYFIDDAVQFSASRVRILHGTGTGALRMAIRRYLQSASEVQSFHDEDVRFGGAGITVVNLK